MLKQCIESLEQRLVMSVAAPAFGPPISLGLSSNTPNIVAADLNADGKAELVEFTPGSPGVTIVSNTTTDASTSPSFSGTTQTIDTGTHNVKKVFVGDTNNDTFPDIILQYSDFNIAFAYGSAGGTFGAPVDLSPSFTPSTEGQVGDLINGAGKSDLIMFNKGGTSVSIFNNQTTDSATTPSFSSAPDQVNGSSHLESVSSGDINNDGNNDLVLGYTDANPGVSFGTSFGRPAI